MTRQDAGQTLAPELPNVWDPTLFEGLEGGDLELGQFFVPVHDASGQMH